MFEEFKETYPNDPETAIKSLKDKVTPARNLEIPFLLIICRYIKRAMRTDPEKQGHPTEMGPGRNGEGPAKGGTGPENNETGPGKGNPPKGRRSQIG